MSWVWFKMKLWGNFNNEETNGQITRSLIDWSPWYTPCTTSASSIGSSRHFYPEAIEYRNVIYILLLGFWQPLPRWTTHAVNLRVNWRMRYVQPSDKPTTRTELQAICVPLNFLKSGLCLRKECWSVWRGPLTCRPQIHNVSGLKPENVKQNFWATENVPA